jgi:Ca2+-transporting ATPase
MGSARTRAGIRPDLMQDAGEPSTPHPRGGAQLSTGTTDIARHDDTPWFALDADATLTALGSSAEGLSSQEAARRLEEHGPNVIERSGGDSVLTILWRQINNPLIWVLIASSALAIALGKVEDGLVVAAVVVINTIIGFIQEYKAGQAIEALAQMVPEFATVIRDGRNLQLPVAELVPGDVVMLASGDKGPADMRLIESRNLQVEEAALTGESVPTEKSLAAVAEDAQLGDRTSMVFGGTLVTYGTGRAVVVATGQRTELGKVSNLLDETVDLETPLTVGLHRISKVITVAVLVLAAAMIVVGTVRTTSQGVSLSDALTESAVFAISLAVGAIPEGLPAIVTVALAIGVRRMAARRAIVRKLPAIETLGSTTVINSDKTGTLTRNEMTVQRLVIGGRSVSVSGVGYEPVGDFAEGNATLGTAPQTARELLLDAALCSDATLEHIDGRWEITGDPTEAALVVAAEKAGIEVATARAEHPRRDAIPFESENQFMATLNALPDGGLRLIVKGAPEVVAARSVASADGGPLDADAIHREVEAMAEGGMRVLGFAVREWTGDPGELELDDAAGLTFAGLVGMIDPPRTEAIEAIEACHRAGITVKMITGDHRLTAAAIGRELGLLADEPAITGAEIEQMDDAELRRAVSRTNVFARVAPEHKLRLVRALQEEGHVAAMTGDGTNDAPALKQANIGVAMGITGTSVSKEAADIVLTDDNFATIEAAVEEGRRVYDNLVKSLAFVLPTNLGLALILMFAILFFPFDEITQELLLPIQPTQILWINLVASVALAVPLAFEVAEPDVMRRPPRDPSASPLSRFVIVRTVLVAILMAAGAIALYAWEYTTQLDAGVSHALAIRDAQTMAVTTVIFFQIFYVLNCRSLRGSIRELGAFSNRAVFIGIGVLVVLQLAFVYTAVMNAIFDTAPLTWGQVGLAALVGATILPVISLEKAIRRRRGAS